MQRFIFVIRLIYGLFWLVFGLNGFAHFFPTPAAQGEAANFMAALEGVGYVMPLVYVTQILVGILLLAGFYIPLALLMLAPVIGNILLYDLFLNPSGLAIGIVLLAIYGFLLYACRHAFLPLITKLPENLHANPTD